MSLTHKQREYCKARANGASYSEAYRLAKYGKGKQARKTATDNAYNMENKSVHSTEIKQKIEELRQRAEDKSILERKERQVMLSDIALSGTETTKDRLKALDILARMSGDYNERLSIEGTMSASLTYEERLETIRSSIDSGD